MPVPIIAATFGGVIISSLVAFFTAKIPAILTALGLSLTVYAGMDSMVGYFISEIQSSVSGVGSINFGGRSINVLGLIASAGVIDALNIVLSGYMAVSAIKMTKVSLSALKPTP